MDQGSAETGRYRGKAWSIFNTGFGQPYYLASVSGAPSAIYFGCDIRYLDGGAPFGSFTSYAPFWTFRDTTDTEVLHFRLKGVSNQLEIWSAGLIRDVVTINLDISAWHHLQFRVDTGGTVEIKRDGVSIYFNNSLAISGGVTNNIRWTGPTWAQFGQDGYVIDNVWFATGGYDGGQREVITTYPLRDKENVGWTASPSATQLKDNIDEDYPGPVLTDYIYSSAASQRYMAQMAFPGSMTDIAAVALNAWCYTSAGGTQQIELGTKNASDHFGPAQTVPNGGTASSNYRRLQQIWEVNPETGLAWTAAEIRDYWFGFRTPVGNTGQVNVYAATLEILCNFVGGNIGGAARWEIRTG